MKEITLEQLVDLVIEKARNTPFGENDSFNPYKGERTKVRASLLKRIEELQQEAEEWHKMADSLNRYTHHHGDCSLRRNYRDCDCGLWELQNRLDADLNAEGKEVKE